MVKRGRAKQHRARKLAAARTRKRVGVMRGILRSIKHRTN